MSVCQPLQIKLLCKVSKIVFYCDWKIVAYTILEAKLLVVTKIKQILSHPEQMIDYRSTTFYMTYMISTE